MKENANTFREKAEELFNKCDFNGIIALLTNEFLDKQKDAILYAWRARANHRLDLDVAITLLFAEKSIEKDPNYFMGYFVRGCAWEEKKEKEKALADYTKAIEISPVFADAYYNRGLIWQSKKENKKAIEDFDKAIANYSKALEINPRNSEIYLSRGNTWYYKEDYDNAIVDYTKAIVYNKDFTDAYYNRGLAWFAKKKFNEAIADYTKVIELKPDYKDVFFIDRGLAWKAQGKYKEAIDDYNEAIKINPDFENAYYIRGLAKKDENIDLEGSKQDFEKYLEMAIDENEIWTRYAKYYIRDLDILIKDPALRSIRQSIDNIKGQLLIKEKSITHYTSLSVLKSLILDNSKFRISEGNFMNDPSEGKEFFNYINKPNISRKKISVSDTFSPKPFIGSFVSRDKHNDLNMWRFYGKEKGIEAKGCAVTFYRQQFIDNIISPLSNEKNKDARLDDESDIFFYRVVYVAHNGDYTFYIQNSNDSTKSKKFKMLMEELKKKAQAYNGDNRRSLEESLNNIAFLFKSDAYKNENEVRLIVKGNVFKKEYNMNESSPRVYIELAEIKNIVSQIILGPKVDKVSEWKAAFHYSYEKKKAPEIKKSHLPYK